MPTTAPTMLSLTNVSIFRGDKTILRDINWQVRRGENWAVLGANGAGKSTLAAAIAGEAAFSGDIDYGFETNGADPCKRIASVSFRLHRLFVAQADGYYQSRWYPGEEEATLTAREVLRSVCEVNSRAGTPVPLSAVAKTMGIEALPALQTLHPSTGEMRRHL